MKAFLNRVFKLEGFGTTENVVVDNELRTITSTVAGDNLSKFTSKNWLRLRPGSNTLLVTSNGNVKITCPRYAMIGI